MTVKEPDEEGTFDWLVQWQSERGGQLALLFRPAGCTDAQKGAVKGSYT